MDNDEMMSPFVRPQKFDTKLYSDKLISFSKYNKEQMDLVKQELLNINPCHDFDMLHWHLLDDKKVDNEEEEKESHNESKMPPRESANVFFAKASIFDGVTFDDPIDRVEHERANSSYCQLCLDNCNDRHHLKRERKIRGRPRIPYDNIPQPTARPKEQSPEPEKNEILYKVIVKTGRGINYGTNLPVFLTLLGKKGRVRKRQLTKKQGSLSFHFRPGISETFFIKGPDIDELEYVGVELVSDDPEGPPETESWFLDHITITNLSSKNLDTYNIHCKDWLSRFYSDKKTKRKLAAEKERLIRREFKITTFTANKAMAGLQAAAYISFYGTKRDSPKLALKNDEKMPFQRGSKDEFVVETNDFGDLKGVRIGHDGGYSIYLRKQREKKNNPESADTSEEMEDEDVGKPFILEDHMCDWLLERLIVKDNESSQRHEFPVNKWVGKNYGQADYIDLWLPKQMKKPLPAKKPKEDTHYVISIITGKQQLAGTDSTVFLEIGGTRGKTSHLKFADTDKKRFEKGGSDRFDIESANIGRMKTLKIWHDGQGMAPGWFCEKVTVERSLTANDIYDWLNSQREAGKLPAGLVMIDGKVVMIKIDEEATSRYDKTDEPSRKFSEIRDDRKIKSKWTDKKKKKRSSSSSSASSSSDEKKKKKKSHKRDRKNSSDDDFKKLKKEKGKYSSDEEDSPFRNSSLSADDLKELKSNETASISLPYSEIVVFPCNRWLAKDEDDGKLERVLEGEKAELLFSKVEVRYKVIHPSSSLRLMQHKKPIIPANNR